MSQRWEYDDDSGEVQLEAFVSAIHGRIQIYIKGDVVKVTDQYM